jgi:hypothetical protein
MGERRQMKVVWNYKLARRRERERNEKEMLALRGKIP